MLPSGSSMEIEAISGFDSVWPPGGTEVGMQPVLQSLSGLGLILTVSIVI